MQNNFLKHIILIFGLLSIAQSGVGQSYWFGLKGGVGANFQNWGDGSGSSINRDPLFSLNGDLFVESYDPNKKGALYASLGFHTRGSSARYFSFNNNFQGLQKYKFNNIVLDLGAKKSLGGIKDFIPFFILGIRGEYTISTNLDNYSDYGIYFYPHNDFVNHFVYGITMGGGFETQLSEFYGAFCEFSIQPDMAYQYDQPPIQNVTEPYTGNTVNLAARRVRNITLELKVGLKFLRKVEYID